MDEGAGGHEHGARAPSRFWRAFHDALWRPPSELERILPSPAPEPVPPPRVGGVCAERAARKGVPARRVRRNFALTVVPVLLYPVLWLVHAAGRPRARGRAAANRQLILVAAALFTAWAVGPELYDYGIPRWAALVVGAATGAPMLLLARSPLLTWRLMVPAQAVVFVLPRDIAVETGVPDYLLPPFLIVLYLVGAQYHRGVVSVVGVATTAVFLTQAGLPGRDLSDALVYIFAAVAALVVGDNVRVRREEHGVRAAPAPPPSDRPAIPLLDGLVDAVWRAPVRRPGGPMRLLGGPRRPRDTRLIAGVCAAFARRSRWGRIALRVVAVVLLPGTAVVVVGVYAVLWLLMPSEDDPPPASGTGPGPKVLVRERIAWGVLCAVSVGASAAAGAQLAFLQQIPQPLPWALGAAVGLPLALVPAVPLLAWRLGLAGLALAVVGGGVYGEPPTNLWPWPAAGLVVMALLVYAVAVAHGGRTAAGVAAATALVGFLPATVLTGTPVLQTLWPCALAAGIAALGANVRGRLSAQRELAREAELRRREHARQAALEERSRIARELHDVVSHHMSMIAIQAEAAPYKYPGLPDGAAETFTTIRDASREALTEMRRVVRLLREQGEDAERAPQPGLDRLGELVEGARTAGMRVEVDDRSGEADLSEAVGRSAYRIVQEALSNAAQHAPGARVEVALAPVDGALEVSVANGPAAQGGGGGGLGSGGHGLVGMRERAAVLGGTLRAGPTPDGGFSVEARLPLGAGGPQ
ncbi:histidine kinase [Nocardiopsis sp. RSe5-2]|uniref:histidine kinase n=1 Tax=Nocardiopsis endophytica TaxID=3018445 RepID=A0ABT4TZD1_9ACTN|nr:ATP-binding protein [Nocardiopsis endophytica]MDA2810053.1 histidine kinase [Nocardiopsis endophytica]